jgi:hypothetical protein
MTTNGIARRPYLRETLLALLVIALTFLNFGHVAVSASGEFTITPDNWCGDPLAPGGLDHAPCHACRIGTGADLPPPPAAIEPITFVATTIAYAVPIVAMELPLHSRPVQPRGPPSLV